VGPWLIEVKSPAELAPWLAGGPPDRRASTVMLVRGDGPVVRVFLPNALDAAKIEGQRVVVWIRDPRVLDPGRGAEIFGEGNWCLAAVLGADGRTAAWVTSDRIGVEDAAFAFGEAEINRKVETVHV
jgi:hypothetical protein